MGVAAPDFWLHGRESGDRVIGSSAEVKPCSLSFEQIAYSPLPEPLPETISLLRSRSEVCCPPPENSRFLAPTAGASERQCKGAVSMVSHFTSAPDDPDHPNPSFCIQLVLTQSCCWCARRVIVDFDCPWGARCSVLQRYSPWP